MKLQEKYQEKKNKVTKQRRKRNKIRKVWKSTLVVTSSNYFESFPP
jgi:hypothetical protein